MSDDRKKKFRPVYLLALLLLLVLGALLYGFAAQNTVPDTGIGIGTGDVSGYEITNVTYTYDAVSFFHVTHVHFNIVNPPNGIMPQYVQAAAGMDLEPDGVINRYIQSQVCNFNGPTANPQYTCQFPPTDMPEIEDLYELVVRAAQNPST